jgi:hypothetical protein
MSTELTYVEKLVAMNGRDIINPEQAIHSRVFEGVVYEPQCLQSIFAEMREFDMGNLYVPVTFTLPLPQHSLESEQKEQYSDALFVNLHLQVRSQNAALAQKNAAIAEKDCHIQKLENELKAAGLHAPTAPEGKSCVSVGCQADAVIKDAEYTISDRKELPADAELMLADPDPVLTELGFSSAHDAGYDSSKACLLAANVAPQAEEELVTGVTDVPEPNGLCKLQYQQKRTYSSTEGGYYCWEPPK